MFVTKLRIEKIPSTIHWRLVEPLVWNDRVRVFTVPVGFRTDLTTRWFEGRHTEASVLHDFMLVEGHSFSEANAMMRVAMKELQVHPVRRFIIMTGVTVWGFFKERFV